MRGSVKLFLSCGVFTAWILSAAAQEQSASDGDAFAPENAIVNTGIPFAIGAREARQELRGAFGWDTFQEGLVEGVYFRFDPDGYARFSPSPRLDTDVFEVICRPGTLNCMGRKGAMSVFLNGQGALQLGLNDVAEGDVMTLVEGVSTLPLPPNVLQPLDARLETLLGSGGELVVKRGEAEFGRFSLNGFAAVSAYLRWINAKQDYSVLPRGWPVPNSDPGSSLARTVDWQSPIQSGRNTQPSIANSSPTGETVTVASDVAEVRGELNMLRELLVSRNLPEQIQDPGAEMSSNAPIDQSNNAQTQQIQALQAQAQALMSEIAMLQSSSTAAKPQSNDSLPVIYRASPEVELTEQTARAQPPVVQPQPRSTPIGLPTGAPNIESTQVSEMVAHLTYLMNEIGLDAGTALSLMQSAHAGLEPVKGGKKNQETVDVDPLVATPLHNQVIVDILADLRSQLPEKPQVQPVLSSEKSAAEGEKNTQKAEFKLLSDYFKSSMKKAN